MKVGSMKTKENNNSIYIPKQPKTIKRIAAWIVDFIIVIVLATGFAFLTSLIYHYDDYYNTYIEKQIQYELYVEADEGTLTFQGKNYVLYSSLDGHNDELLKEREMACGNDEEFKFANHKVLMGQIIIPITGAFASLLVCEFILPLCFKHGRTIGLFFFGIGYVTEEDIDVKIKNVFIRFLFGKFIVDVFIPFTGILLVIMNTGYGIIGLVCLLGIPIANIVLLLSSKDKRGIHDFIARMKPCDNTCQIYIKTTEELAKCKAEEDLITKPGTKY